MCPLVPSFLCISFVPAARPGSCNPQPRREDTAWAGVTAARVPATATCLSACRVQQGSNREPADGGAKSMHRHRKVWMELDRKTGRAPHTDILASPVRAPDVPCPSRGCRDQRVAHRATPCRRGGRQDSFETMALAVRPGNTSAGRSWKLVKKYLWHHSGHLCRTDGLNRE